MIAENITNILKELPPETKLVAVSKYHPMESILEAVGAGQRLFGENRPQELQKKAAAYAVAVDGSGLPEVEWHFLGHLQTNKLKMVLPYVSMVQSVDSIHLLEDIDRWGRDNGKVTDILLELHIGSEETKQGFVEEEILDIMFNAEKYSHVRFCGLMGMASHTEDEQTIRADFGRIRVFMDYLQDLFPEYEQFRELSIGMSGDWRIALEFGATFIRIGTAIFGERTY